ncbi:PTS transporter subunit EIIC [Pantoea ananatis]|nr:PTS transporter subunit EIIC [Pantoea ananatis]
MANNQLQIVVGQEVSKLYAEMMLTEEKEDSRSAQKSFSWQEIINAIAAIFTPVIPALAGAGILKGCLLLFLNVGLVSREAGTHVILNAAADGVFYFIPVLLAWSCAVRFRCSIVISISLACCLLLPSLGTFLNSAGKISFAGIPVIPTTYASSVVPVILAIYCYSRLEKLLNAFIPKALALVVTPALSFCIMLPATLLVFGPLGNSASQLAAQTFNTLAGFSPTLTGIVLAAAYPLLVMFGIHRALVPVGINEVALHGSTTLFALYGPSNFAEAGASMGVALRVRDKKMRSVALSASLSSLCGVTEPSLYGINLKYRTPLIAVICGGAVGGALAGFGGSAAYGVVIPSLLTLPAFYGHGFMYFIAGVSASFLTSLLIMLITGVRETDGASSTEAVDSEAMSRKHVVKNVKGVETVCAPVQGTIVREDVNTPGSFFSGKGCSVRTRDSVIRSPVQGVISNILPSEGMIKILCSSGAEAVVSVNDMAGDMTFNVDKGARVAQGDILCELKQKKEDHETLVRVSIINAENFRDVIASSKSLAVTGDKLLTVI